MLIEVIRFNRNCGKDNIDLPFYKILPENEDDYESELAKLASEGIDESIMYSVELPKGIIDYETNIVKYPNLGLKRHISLIMNNEAYRKILRQEIFSIKEYLK